MKPCLILKTGASLPALVARYGDFEDWIAAHLLATGVASHVVDIRAEAALPELQHFSGMLITGSHAMVGDGLSWIERATQLVIQAQARQLPTLGICFGHQLIAQALGGQVAALQPPEFGTVTAQKLASDDPLLAALPHQFQVHTSHFQFVTQLPHGAVVLATTALDSHSAVRFDTQLWGVQFHPEYTLAVVRDYVGDYRQAYAITTELPCQQSLAGTQLLQNFAQHIRQCELVKSG